MCLIKLEEDMSTVLNMHYLGYTDARKFDRIPLQVEFKFDTLALASLLPPTEINKI